jgi:prepilin-type N-terminal cleavage/methylation domain-containing protein
MRKRMQRGFTLMELMVVIVIVAILAAVAVPLYINYVNDARRTEGKGAIGAIVTGANKYFQEHNTYVGMDGLPQNTLADLSDVAGAQGHWAAPQYSNLSATGFTVRMNGQGADYANRWVQLVYTRGTPPVWSDDTTPAAGP